MSISRRETGYNERDLRIAAGLAADLTKEKIAEFVGCERATVYNRLGANKDWIETTAAIIKTAIAQSIVRSVEKAQERMADAYPVAVQNLIEFLESDDAKDRMWATKDLLDRIGGKASQNININKKTETKHEVVVIPGDAFDFMVKSIERSRQVFTGKVTPALPEPQLETDLEILDAEFVEITGSAGAPAGDLRDGELSVG